MVAKPMRSTELGRSQHTLPLSPLRSSFCIDRDYIEEHAEILLPLCYEYQDSFMSCLTRTPCSQAPDSHLLSCAAVGRARLPPFLRIPVATEVPSLLLMGFTC